jgi:phospholipase/carboxylesterase
MHNPHRNQDDPHGDQQLVAAGTDLADASAAAILLHGRGATARSIAQTGLQFHHDGLALLAPQAAGNTWYPNPFTAPAERNEPGRTSGLGAIQSTIDRANDAGIPTEKIIVLGFSQGACLASEFVARNPTRYGGVVAFSGGLIGETIDTDDYEGDLDGTPAFLGCSDVDPHIPEERVHTTATVFEQLHGDVETRIYEGMGHGVNQDELDYVSGMVESLV